MLLLKKNKEIYDKELDGLTPEEILHVRTGIENTEQERINDFVQEKVKSIHTKSPKHDSISSKQIKKISFGISDELYELPKRNYEQPVLEVDESNWYDKTRSANYLKSKQGVGGGHIPGSNKSIRKSMRKNIDVPMTLMLSKQQKLEFDSFE